MRKQLISVAIAGFALLGAAGSARAADIHVGIGIGGYAPPPPVYYGSPPAYYYAPPPPVYCGY